MRLASNKSQPVQIVLWILVIVVAAVFLRMTYYRFYRAAYPVHYSALVQEHSQRNNLPPSLVFAVIRTESGFNPTAQSSVEARGLMQITRETFEWAQMREREAVPLEFERLYDTEVNIRFGTVILRLLLDEFGTAENALCAYHAGWGRMKGWLADPKVSSNGKTLDRIPFADTNYYVDRVLRTQQIYQRLYGMD